MSDCDHMCAKCDGEPCIEFRPKMAVPRELQTDYEMMVTANLLMAASIESIKRKDEQLKAENAKLQEFAAHMANALGIDSEWCDTSWCDTDCMVEFGCQTAYCGGETRCPAWAKLRELGVAK